MAGCAPVGEPAGYRITGRVVDTNGVPLEGVRVDTGSANLTNYFGGYTNSDGAYVIVNATGDITLNAFKYGFTFMNAGWINPLSVTNDMANIDFVAISMPTVSLTSSTNVILENSSDTVFYFVTHRRYEHGLYSESLSFRFGECVERFHLGTGVDQWIQYN